MKKLYILYFFRKSDKLSIRCSMKKKTIGGKKLCVLPTTPTMAATNIIELQWLRFYEAERRGDNLCGRTPATNTAQILQHNTDVCITKYQVHLRVLISVYLYVCPFVCLSFCICVGLYVCLFVCAEVPYYTFVFFTCLSTLYYNNITEYISLLLTVYPMVVSHTWKISKMFKKYA